MEDHRADPGRRLSNLLGRLTGRKDWKALGNIARDRRDWTGAVLHYKKHLEDHPDDSAIRVQFGHVLKESGRFGEAERHYRSALGATPDDGNLHLQIGHLLKLMGRTDEAVRSYEAACRLEENSPAVAELAALRAQSPKSQALPAVSSLPGTGKTYLPVDDLFDYLHHHRTVSGIQRVQLSLITCMLAMPDIHERYGIMFTGPDQSLRLASFAAMGELTEAYADADASHDEVRAKITSVRSQAKPFRLGAADTCFIVGAFWNPRGNLDLPLAVKQARAKLGIYFHDLIPVSHPEYVVEELSSSFTQSLVEVLSLVDFAFSNSEYTAREIERFVARHGLRPFPISPVRLAHVQTGALSEEDEGQVDPDLDGKPYVLCVGTIEARKNHRYLFDLWKALVAEGIDPPKLVFVGRRGWQTDDLMAQIEATRRLDGRLVILHDIPDAELAALYRNCLFTIFPSFVEGWGLPIGESLSHGKLCVASNAASMPEVGGDLVEYFDPWNLRSGVEVVRRLLGDPDQIKQREQAIRARFKPRGWDDFTSELLADIERSSQATATSQFSPALASGVLFLPSKFDRQQQPQRFADLPERQQRLMLVAGWNFCEGFGVWILGRSARLSFRTDLTPGVDVTVYLRLALVTSDTDNSLQIGLQHGTTTTVRLPRGQPGMLVRVPCRTGPNGDVALEFTITGPLQPVPNDGRLLRVGLASLSYAALHDTAARAEIIESLLIDPGALVH